MSALITLALLLCAGHSLIALVGRFGPRRARFPLELHATALMLGAVVVPLLAFYAVWLLGPLSPNAGRIALVLAALPGVARIAAHHRAALVARGQTRPWRPLERGAAAATLAFATFAIFAAATVPMHGFDATFHYAYKAQLLFHEGFGTAAWTDLEGTLGRTMTHPTYPPLVPSLQLLVAWIQGGWNDDAARPLMALFALAPAVMIGSALRRRGRGVALLGALAWLSLPVLYYWRLPHADPLRGVLGLVLGPQSAAEVAGPATGWSHAPNWCLDGTADLPLAAFFLAAFVHVVRLMPVPLRGRGAEGSEPGRPSIPRGDRLDVVATGLFAAGVLGAKNEGLALLAVLAIAVGLGHLGGRGDARASRPRAGGLLAAWGLTALTLAGWFVARRGLPNVDEDYPGRLAPASLLDSLGRSPEVAERFARTFVDVTMWNLTWPLLFAAVAWALSGRRVRWASEECTALLVLSGGCAVYALVLLITPWNLALLATTGIPMRLLLHLTPVAVFATFALLFSERDVDVNA